MAGFDEIASGAGKVAEGLGRATDAASGSSTTAKGSVASARIIAAPDATGPVSRRTRDAITVSAPDAAPRQPSQAHRPRPESGSATPNPVHKADAGVPSVNATAPSGSKGLASRPVAGPEADPEPALGKVRDSWEHTTDGPEGRIGGAPSDSPVAAIGNLRRTARAFADRKGGSPDATLGNQASNSAKATLGEQGKKALDATGAGILAEDTTSDGSLSGDLADTKNRIKAGMAAGAKVGTLAGGNAAAGKAIGAAAGAADALLKNKSTRWIVAAALVLPLVAMLVLPVMLAGMIGGDNAHSTGASVRAAIASGAKEEDVSTIAANSAVEWPIMAAAHLSLGSQPPYAIDKAAYAAVAARCGLPALGEDATSSLAAATYALSRTIGCLWVEEHRTADIDPLLSGTVRTYSSPDHLYVVGADADSKAHHDAARKRWEAVLAKLPVAGAAGAAPTIFRVAFAIATAGKDQACNQGSTGITSAVTAGAWSNPAVGPLTAGFGMRNNYFTGAPEMHTGQDVAPPGGAPIRAAAAGTVSKSEASSIGYGWLILIDHGGGVQTAYAHMYADSVKVHAGDAVTPGQLIAAVGSNGYSTGPHLHFEVRVNTNPVDPVPFLAERGVQIGTDTPVPSAEITLPPGTAPDPSLDLRVADLSDINPVTVPSGTGASVTLNPTQVSVVSQIIGVVESMSLPVRYAVVAIMGAMQESRLGEVGDTPNEYNNAGLFQQRIGDGWYGSLQQVNDPVYATKVFLAGTTPAGKGHIPGILDIAGHETMDEATLIEKSQRSGEDPASTYGKWRTMAENLVASVKGIAVSTTGTSNLAGCPTTGTAPAPGALVAPSGISGALILEPVPYTAGNGYAPGHCTAWAYERRKQLGQPVGAFWGDGRSWNDAARAEGYPVDKTPHVGDVLVDEAGTYGHVAIVEKVNPDGTWEISEANFSGGQGGWNKVSSRTFPAGAAAAFEFVGNK